MKQNLLFVTPSYMKKLLSLLFLMTMVGNAWGDIAAGTYKLCTSTDDLEAGAHYIIANGTSGKVQVAINTNNETARNCRGYDVIDSQISVATGSVILTLTLERSTNSWAFHTDNYNGTGYLASAATSGNKECRVIQDAPTGTISFSNSQAIITLGPNKTYNILRYNSNGSFACYESGKQSPIYLYKLQPADPTYTPVTPSLTLAAKSADNFYATFSSDKVVFIPQAKANAQVMKANVVGENITFTPLDEATATIDVQEISGYYVPANTGVLVKSTSNSVAYYTVENKTVASLTDNMLYPASKAKSELNDCLFYKLAYASSAKNALGFYYGAANGGSFTSRTGSAYLAVPTNQGSAKTGWTFDWNDDTASVSSLQEEKVEDAPFVYNLIGQRVNANTKGIVIINGRKYINK